MIKFSFKLEVLYQYLKSINYEQHVLITTDNKKIYINTSGKTSEKHSFRNSNSYTKVGNSSEIENLPGYDNEMNKLNQEEKDEFFVKIKNYDTNYISTIFNIIHNKQFYQKLKNKQLLEILRKTFNEIVLKENINEISCENEFFLCFKDVFNMTEYEALEIYDLFKFNENFIFSEECFICLIYLFASFECGQLEECFSIFSDEIFSLINGEEKIMSLNRLKDFGRVIGINERILHKLSVEFKFEINTIIDINKYKLYYIAVSKIHDDSLKITINIGSSSGSNSLKKSSKLPINVLTKIHI